MVDFSLGTVVSSRIRLARNVNGYPFPARLKSDRQAKEIIRSVSAAINKVDEFRLYYMDGISEDEAVNLVENRLISPALLASPSRSAALISEKDGVLKGDISIMINEEDHLREQCISSGLSLRSAYEKMSSKDSLIAKSIPFAYDEQFGYLTACPTNLGTGLRASVMLFLPALELAGIMPDVIKSVTRLGLTVRGAYGEGTKATGYIYQVSNEVTLGIAEDAILSQVENVVKKIVEMEAVERQRLKNGALASAVKDKCMRAYGILTNCALMTADELELLCADLKLAACLGYIGIEDISAVDNLTLKMKPSNLNVSAGRPLDEREREEYCALQVTDKIRKLVKKL